MLFEQEYKDACQVFQSRIASLKSMHEQLVLDNEEKKKVWCEEWAKKEIERKLPAVLQCIESSKFRRYIKNKLKITRLVPDTQLGNFDKMMYYIDFLNQIETKSKIFKYNPEYCHKIMDVIVSEYLRARHWLEIEESVFNAKEKASYDGTCAAVAKEWDRFCNVDIDALAKKSAESIRRSFE